MAKIGGICGVVALLCVLGSGGALAGRDLSASEKEVVADAVKRQLIDPQSAQFRWGPRGDGDSYCAEVNSKNSLGGYVGFTPFIAMLEEKNGKVFNAAILMIEGTGTYGSVRTICGQEGYGEEYFNKTK